MKNSLLKISLFALLLIGLTNSSCKKDDPSLEECLYGNWEVKIFTAANQPVVPQNMTLELDEDGDFTLNFVLNGTENYRMDGEWLVNEERQELRLIYDIQDDYYVGIGGFFLGQDIPSEEYEVTKTTDKEGLTLEGKVSGLDIMFELERD